MLYFLLSGSVVFIFTGSTILLCTSIVYLRESPIWKGEVGVLVYIESIQTLFDGLTKGMYNFCETISLINSSSSSGVKPIVFPVHGSSLVNIEAKEKFKVEYLDIDTTLLQNKAKFLKPDWISNYGRQFSEWAIVFMHIQKSHVKIEYFLFVSTHVTS